MYSTASPIAFLVTTSHSEDTEAAYFDDATAAVEAFLAETDRNAAHHSLADLEIEERVMSGETVAVSSARHVTVAVSAVLADDDEDYGYEITRDANVPF